MTEKESKKIWLFTNNQTVLTLATTVNDHPYCCNCFYIFDEDTKVLVFKSSDDTKHVKDLKLQPNVAGTISPDLTELGTIKGIQFSGKIISLPEDETKRLSGKYYKKYPYARVMSGNFWIVQLDFVKMTDNKLGIGKKLIWNNN